MKHIAIVGGTGALGSGLTARWGRYGHHITIGSRDPAKAEQHAEMLSRRWQIANISGASNSTAAANAEVVCIAVPYSAHAATLAELKNVVAGKLVIEATVPLLPPKVSVVQLPAGGSLAAQTQILLGDSTKVVSAFHNISAELLQEPATDIDCDVMVFGNDEAACAEVISLTYNLGLRGVSAGPIGNSVAAETMTSILIGINRRYRAHGAGIRFTGLSTSASS
ncbi:NADPH-dependent F420 reductase [Pseudorhodoplanes sp.]|uniref:NADPH-dependent F420 reductase n=1 Tax=Pseudorhodoplanes sp. TaxID=1934341 RepID=UPI003D0CF1B9